MWRTHLFFRQLTPVSHRLPPQATRRRSISSLTASHHGPLFNHSTGRWMYNEEKRKLQSQVLIDGEVDLRLVYEELAARSVYFDIEQLKHVACAALGVTACIHIEKIAEGSYNKVFRMQFEDGRTAIARIPSSPLLGNASMITASEVATMEFMRLHETLGIPLVYSWSKDANNAVQSPYILMEDIQGVPLLHDWYQIQGNPVRMALRAFANDVKRMSVISFSQIGSLYFKEDLPPDLQSRPLFSREVYSDPILELFQPAVDRFRVGPIADHMWWRTMHDDADADRGPWKDISGMLLAAVRLEERAVAKYKDDPARLRSTHTNSLQDLERVEDLLKKVAVLAPSISLALRRHRAVGDGLAANVAVHADLGPNNIMTPRDDGTNTTDRFKKLTYIDWQGTCILPLALQSDVPALMQYNGHVIKIPDDFLEPIPWPEGMDRLGEEDQEFIRSHHRLASRECAYKDMLCRGLTPFAATHAHCLYPWITQLPTRVLRGVADGPVLLRECLVSIFQTWDAEECHGRCPISFTAEEIAAHGVELNAHQQYEWNAELVRRAMDSDIDGWVTNEEYEKARMVIQAACEQWDPAVCGGPCPFEDGKWSFFLT